ncbi:MAG: hypothetical protein JWM88_414, partial [Verrucomicrobia bacterium]|nr:hypothetical protein [Verrucomicrobiota bacterium]
VPVSEIYRPEISLVITGESGTTRVPQRPKLDPIAAEDTGANGLPSRMICGSADGSDLCCMPSRPKFAAVEATNPNHMPSRPKLGESGNDRTPRLNRAEFVTAKSRPKVRGAAVMTL